MERTINGRPLREVFEKLRKDIPGVIRYTDRTEYPYLEVNVMRNYFDELIPVSNYDFIIDEAKLYQTEASANACVVARIVLYDDAGIKVCEKCYTGTSEAKKSKDTGELLDIPGTITNATVDARKNCIRLFGCGERQIVEAIQQRKESEAAKKKGYNDSRLAYRNEADTKKTNTNGQRSGKETNAFKRLPQEGNLEYGNIAVRISYEKGKRISNYAKFFLVPVTLPDFRKTTSLVIWKDRHVNAEEVARSLESASRAVVCAGVYESYNNGTRFVFDHFAEGAAR